EIPDGPVIVENVSAELVFFTGPMDLVLDLTLTFTLLFAASILLPLKDNKEIVNIIVTSTNNLFIFSIHIPLFL
ncbi:hypothetical protein F5ESL0237_08095, partial [Lactobacillus sp. ESL0237]|uniref:hypothetical protein n=1 Tax=Lactobacillus sp. ESL0237 TaxID=2069357 RepID=UPI000F2C979C